MKKRIISIILSVIMCMSFLCSCTSSSSEQSESNDVSQEQGVKKYTFNGTHIFTAPERTDYLVQNGRTEYTLVVPKNADLYTSMALSEFLNFFQQATGIAMPYITEDDVGLTHSATAKYISIGNTKMYQSSGLTFDENVVKSEGVRIVTKDNTIYINGGKEGGVLYGVYDILQILFNYEIFYQDCWYIDKNVKDLKMRQFDVTDVPDIQNRQNVFYCVLRNQNNIAYRFRQPKSYLSDIMPLGDTESGETESPIHNSKKIISENYEGYESQWSGDGTRQLCYTAHGDVESYSRMVDRAVEVIKKGLIKYNPADYPQYRVGTFTIVDGAQNCSCQTCAKLKDKYGAHSAGPLLFCNAVMAKIRSWMEEPENAAYRRDDFRLFFYAYNSYIEPPVLYNETTERYEFTSSDLEIRDDVGLFLATAPFMHLSRNIYEDVNEPYRMRYIKWADVASNVYVWTYCITFTEYQAYSGYEVFDADYYQLMAQADTYAWINQGAHDSYVSSFQEMKAYLDAKLTWDTSLDRTELVKRYFENMYGPAADTMQEILMQMQLHRNALLHSLGYFDNNDAANHLSLRNKNFWPLQLVREWVSLFDKAYAEIEKAYKVSDPETYEKLKTHIDKEFLGTAFHYLDAYKDNPIDVALYEKVRTYFKTELAKLSLGNYKTAEGKETMADWIKTL